MKCTNDDYVNYSNKSITNNCQGSAFGLSIAIIILAGLTLVDLYARKTEMEKAKLIALGRVAIEIVVLLIYYIITIGWINKASTERDLANNCGCYIVGSFYEDVRGANSTFTGLYSSMLILDVIMVVIGFLKSRG